MLRRILGRMGVSGYIPGSNDFGIDNRNTDAPDAPLGEAHIDYLGGAKIPFTAEEASWQEPGEDAEADLVWPSKPTTIGMRNEESLAYRYNLTLTNLPADHYMILPPMGGTRQPEGGVLLQPGEEASFEVRFPPIAREGLSPQSFHFVLTRFDPRRRNDPGVVVGEDAARWVPLPSENDFALRVNTAELRLRPWRRNAKFLLSLDDRSFLAAAANLHVLRAPTRQTLGEHAEQVETISQALPARTSATWRCTLPPSRLRNSYWLTVRGAVRAGEHKTVPIGLTKPLYVRYIPWLRMGRDWAFLSVALLGLLWCGWGIPVRRAPNIQMSVKFGDLAEGELPKGGSWDDLNLQIVSIDNKKLTNPIPGVYRNNQFVFEDFPRRWYGYRWPFHSWSSWGPAPHKMRVEASVLDPDKRYLYAKYDLAQIKSTENDPASFSIPSSSRPFMGEWVLTPKAVARVTKGVRLNVSLPNTALLRDAAQNGREIKLMAAMDGEKVLEKSRIPSRDDMQLLARDLDLNLKRAGTLKVWAVVGDTESDPWVQDVHPRQEPFEAHLTFPGPPEVHAISGKFKPGDSIVINGNRLHNQGDVFINNQPVSKAQWSASRVAFAIPRDTPPGLASLDIRPQGSAQPLHVGTITVRDLETTTISPEQYELPSPPVRTPKVAAASKSVGHTAGVAKQHPAHSGSAATPVAGAPGQSGTATATGANAQNTNPTNPPLNNSNPVLASSNARQDAAGLERLKRNGIQPRSLLSGAQSAPITANLDGFSAYELFAMEAIDQAEARVDTMLLDKRAKADKQATAHAIKGMILLKRGQLAAEDEIASAMNIARRLRGGRGRALAYLAQARLEWKHNNVPQSQIIGTFTQATQADHSLALAWADEAEYYASVDLRTQADSVYRYGLIYNPHSPLLHYRFARMYYDMGSSSKTQEQLQLMMASERSSKRKQVYSALAEKLNAS